MSLDRKMTGIGLAGLFVAFAGLVWQILPSDGSRLEDSERKATSRVLPETPYAAFDTYEKVHTRLVELKAGFPVFTMLPAHYGYADFLREIALSPEREAELIELLEKKPEVVDGQPHYGEPVDGEIHWTIVVRSFYPAFGDAEIEAYKQHLDQDIEDLLGGEDFRALGEFERTLEARRQLYLLVQILTDDLALDSSQHTCLLEGLQLLTPPGLQEAGGYVTTQLGWDSGLDETWRPDRIEPYGGFSDRRMAPLFEQCLTSEQAARVAQFIDHVSEHDVLSDRGVTLWIGDMANSAMRVRGPVR